MTTLYEIGEKEDEGSDLRQGDLNGIYVTRIFKNLIDMKSQNTKWIKITRTKKFDGHMLSLSLWFLVPLFFYFFWPWTILETDPWNEGRVSNHWWGELTDDLIFRYCSPLLFTNNERGINLENFRILEITHFTNVTLYFLFCSQIKEPNLKRNQVDIHSMNWEDL